MFSVRYLARYWDGFRCDLLMDPFPLVLLFLFSVFPFFLQSRLGERLCAVFCCARCYTEFRSALNSARLPEGRTAQ